MNVEVLAPAGNMESLQAAFAAGADAVYFGLPLFGARAFAQNFTLEQAKEVIDQAHQVSKKIYITMNTLIEEDQMEQAYEYAKALHEMGVDALIVQDLGLIHLLHHRLPNLELHASTQLSVTTPYQIEQLRKLGIKRVVLAREATIEQIEACAKTGMELEAFVHGALCISYSGQCRFSQVRYDRSGNKGACAQPCRMEYTLLEDGKPVSTQGRYLLSPRDLSLITKIDRMHQAGVYSFKIEGRMKSPEYVYQSVHAAKMAIAGHRLTAEDLDHLKTAFNRGYTFGHTFEQTGLSLMNPQTSNHQGVEIGEVLFQKNDRVRVKLSADLSQNDGLRFVSGQYEAGGVANFIYDAKGKLINKAKAGQIVDIKINQRVNKGAIVRRTSSFEMTKEVENAIKKNKPQAEVDFSFYATQMGGPLRLVATDGVHSVEVELGELQQAKTAPTTPEQIEHALSKTGNSWANVRYIDIELCDNPFIPNKMVNELRRQALEQLDQKRSEKQPIKECEYDFQLNPCAMPKSFVEITKKEQVIDDGLLQVSEFNLNNTIHKASLIHDQGMYCDHLGQGQIVENMNITNSYALAALLELGYQGAVLSGELSDTGRADLLAAFKSRYGFDAPVIYTIYEKPRLMIMKHCPVNTALKDGKRKNCALCRQHQYSLKGKDGKLAYLYGNVDCNMQIFDEDAIDQIDQIPAFKQQGIHAFRMIFSVENQAQTKAIRQHFLEMTQEN
ncbi:MAG: U32 family peptidase [Erysipelotrichaceae bacterium]|nr:U32 family peptidase [Erysipelotrichaceae bacterium]